MSCFGCSRKYGLFCKEYGCPNCGYSYCAKCLKRPVTVFRCGGKMVEVCLICFDKLSKQDGKLKIIDYVAVPRTVVEKTLLKVSDAKPNVKDTNQLLDKHMTESVSLAKILTPTTSNERKQELYSHVEIDESLDSAINKRLHNLKTVDTTDDNIRIRLANLTGGSHRNFDRKELLLNTDQRTNQEKTHELLEQFLGESKIDKRIQQKCTDAISDIERRLNALRDTTIGTMLSGTDSTTESTNSIDAITLRDTEADDGDERHLKKIMEKYIAEANLPASVEPHDTEDTTSIPQRLLKNIANFSHQKELPWCNMCNEDSFYRCYGCDGELFCVQCFQELHNDEEYREHAKEKFSSQIDFKDNNF